MSYCVPGSDLLRTNLPLVGHTVPQLREIFPSLCYLSRLYRNIRHWRRGYDELVLVSVSDSRSDITTKSSTLTNECAANVDNVAMGAMQRTFWSGSHEAMWNVPLRTVRVIVRRAARFVKSETCVCHVYRVVFLLLYYTVTSWYTLRLLLHGSFLLWQGKVSPRQKHAF